MRLIPSSIRSQMSGFLDIPAMRYAAGKPAPSAPEAPHKKENASSFLQPLSKLDLSFNSPPDFADDPSLISRVADCGLDDTSVPLAENMRRTYVVLKFGGTSVAKHLPSIVDLITPSQLVSQGRVAILVCSAQSYTVKAEGTTQCLLAAIDAALQPSESRPDISGTQTADFIDKPVASELMTPPPTPPRSGSPSRPQHASLPALDTSNSTDPSPRTIVEGIFQRHCKGARSVILQPSLVARNNDMSTNDAILTRLEEELRTDCDRVIRLLTAVETLREISPRTRDMIVSVGELMACRTAVAAFHSRGIAARLLDLTDLDISRCRGVVSDASLPDHHRGGQALDQASLENVVESIRDRIAEASTEQPAVLVATGFFGPVPGSLLESIGRGYTDVCAALCARAVAADELQIWKEVDGVFSADPRKIANARPVPVISSNHAKILTSYGSEVIHHRAIDQADISNIPIVVKNVANPAGPGTRVVISPDLMAGPQLQWHAKRTSSTTPFMFAVTILDHLEMVHVHFDNLELSSDGHPISIMSDIMKIAKDRNAGLGMDLVNSSLGDVSFVIRDATSRSSECESELQKSLQKLRNVASVTVSPEMSYLQVVFGHHERHSHSIPCEILRALAEAKTAVKMISYGPMGSGMGFVIPSSAASAAAAAVHDALLCISQ
ncbi:putative aspartokinase [Lyophyllum shimeji]|uniref:Aspartokinase n=1 Tax=Lyophyllum shimeji TaxID=47721 RepID=A0A9P3UMP3_LYOSH|nr:putative aspartokinase [Lyophyllum shimeji]